MVDNLFSFQINNTVPVLLALIPAILNLVIFVYILFYMPPKASSIVFALFTLGLFLWQIDDVLARITPQKEVFAIWDKLLSVGWITIGPLGLLFALIYTGRKKLLRNKIIIALLIIPAIIFLGLYKIDFFPHNHEYQKFWGWVDSHNKHPVDSLMIVWIALQVLIMMFLLIQFAWKHRNSKILSRQSTIIAIGMVIPAVQGIITQAFLPIVLNVESLPLTSSFLTFFSISTVIALNKYKLFELTEAISTESLLNSMSEMVITLSPEEEILYMNPYGKSLAGVTNLEGYHLKRLFKSESEYRLFIEDVFIPSMMGDYIENFETIILDKYGQEYTMLISADPVRENSTIVGVLVVAHDISKIKLAEEEIRQKNLELQRSNAELESFAFVASHDMKEPLRMVSSYTQLLERRYKDTVDEEGKEYIKFAVEGVHRMQALINDLLSYARIGRDNLEKSKIDLQKLIEDVKVNLSVAIEEKSAVIKYSKLPEIKGIPVLIQRLFQNLIENAIKFQQEGKDPEIKINASDWQNSWLIEVKDNGIGINPEYKNKVFMLFQRLHVRSQFSGTGIGLSVCKKIVELHGGDIWFEPNSNQGTTFYFTLPK